MRFILCEMLYFLPLNIFVQLFDPDLFSSPVFPIHISNKLCSSSNYFIFTLKMKHLFTLKHRKGSFMQEKLSNMILTILN